MPGVFDRLQRQIDEQSRGISVLDIAGLPPALRRVMRMMLRETEMSFPALLAGMQSLPEEDRLERAGLQEALTRLTEQEWLIRLGEGEQATYRVNLRRRAGSGLSGDLWSALDKKIGRPASETEGPEK